MGELLYDEQDYAPPAPAPSPRIDMSLLWPVIQWLSAGDRSQVGQMTMSPEDFEQSLGLVMGMMGGPPAGRGKMPNWWEPSAGDAMPPSIGGVQGATWQGTPWRWGEQIGGTSGGGQAYSDDFLQWGTPQTQGIPRSAQDIYGMGQGGGDNPYGDAFEIFRSLLRTILPPGSQN